ncbi:hypothetical protein S7335_516 [Synechococcus sp. PCC 7335]|uniref:MgtC/SapB family protein n=1 Tax=Synechococcus sp. (strain ATCC 29403 / PCC 7335) TaxID=91464 RepID=UPI00017EE0FC|nr:DUF4010 domain-containing protein [Synechococcus sp. PCC 7335]EDX83336.1 hypothetical protein S7335_516 [Synechococcus sp. PCC 7335]
MDWTIVTRLAIALALGLILGTERGWENQQVENWQNSAEEAAAGLRSFGIVGLLGGLTVLLAGASNPLLIAGLFLGFSLLVTASYWLTAKRTHDFGITTELTLLLTFCLGALSVVGYTAESIAVAVVVAAILGFKQEMHSSIHKLNRAELLATLQLLLIAVVALPLLPNQPLGPWQAVNPRTVGLLVMLISATAYGGYFAVRLLGERLGLLLTAILGGLVSSTAVTIAFARMNKQANVSPMLLGAGISLAAGTMALRLLVEIAVVNADLLSVLVPPMACLSIVPLVATVAISYMLSRRASAQKSATRRAASNLPAAVKLGNPIDLRSALIYSGGLTLLFVLVRAAEAWLGESGIYLLSAISGIADVDAVSLSLAASANSGLAHSIAVRGILLAVAVNTLVKAGIALAIGGYRLARWSTTILIASLGLGGVTALIYIN